MPSSKIEFKGFARQYERELERRVMHGMGRGMSGVVSAARGAPTRYRIRNAILAKIRGTRPKRGKNGKGLYAVVIAPDFRSLWFELGTLVRRKRALKKSTLARRQTLSGQARLAKTAGRRGIIAQRFLQKGLRQGWDYYLDQIRRELRSIGRL